MKLIVGTIGNNPTVEYAWEEMFRLLKKIDPSLLIDSRIYRCRTQERNDILWLGIDGTVEASDTDEIYIAVNHGAGIITGSNPRSVLIAAYRFLFELGCRFLYPGADGEVVPSRKLTEADFCVSVQEKASYQHRGICIEGAAGYEHVRNMIEWLPKAGMNSYFVQFQVPGIFFRRFYNENPNFSFSPVDDEDISHIWRRLEGEISKRDLAYHAVGHGWTCEPFGIHATDWGKYEGSIPENIQKYFAKVNGVRALWGGKALNTNLCYSNPEVRDKMTDAVVSYCKAHPAVDFVHFWLADAENNHCECAECVKKIPADHYVTLLNTLDRKLSAAGIATKIVCLVYVDLLWAPECEKIENPDRFVLMFAPVTRTYTHALSEFHASQKIVLSPYVRNRLKMPESIEENIARLSKWQAQCSSDSFDFDYHLMWDHYTDPGYYECAKILHTDMVNLNKLGLNGMVSCQAQRVAFPTGLPLYAMAKGLWNKASKFQDISREYFTAAFGTDAAAVESYLSSLSGLFDPEYMRGEKEKDPQGQIKKYTEAKQIIEEFRCGKISVNANSTPSWKNLKYHAELCLWYADTVITCLSGASGEEKESAKAAFSEYIFHIEPDIHEVFDAINYDWSYRKYLSLLEHRG